MKAAAGFKPAFYSRGVALITVMLVVSIATITAVAMTSRQEFDIRKTENLLRADQAWQVAVGIDSWAVGYLVKNRGVVGGNAIITPTAVDGGELAAVITDLQGRFNINNLVRNGQPSDIDVARFRRLLTVLDLNPELTDAVIDWIDPDSNIRFPAGAEDETYQNSKPPYRAANGYLSDPRELTLINGFDVASYSVLKNYVSTLPGYYPVNINSAPAPVLMTLANDMSVADAEGLIAARENEPFTNLEDFLAHPMLAGRELKTAGLSVSSNYFMVDGEVKVGRSWLRYASILSQTTDGKIRVLQRLRKGVFDG